MQALKKKQKLLQLAKAMLYQLSQTSNPTLNIALYKPYVVVLVVAAVVVVRRRRPSIVLVCVCVWLCAGECVCVCVFGVVCVSFGVCVCAM